LEKLLGAGSFDGFINCLACRYAILLVFSNKFGFLSKVWIVVFTFLGYNWALIFSTFVIRFLHDDHPILLDVVTNVETNTSPFQITLQKTCTL
jgi:hypothetical protein